MLNEQELAHAESRRLTAQLRTNGAAGASNRHHMLFQKRADKLHIEANRITVDFSVPPKGGPPNLTGVLTLPTPGRPGATAIVWPDGNKWPQEKK